MSDLEQRLARDEARLAYDEARLEAEESEVAENRVLAWFAVALALVLVVAVTALVLGVLALREDVGSLSRSAPAGSVSTAALQEGAVTASRLAPRAVERDALAPGAVGGAQVAPNALSGGHVARDTLTGADVRESSLRAVPEAKVAADARRLGGFPAALYLSRVVDVSSASAVDAARVKGPLTARCPDGWRVVSGGAAIRGAAGGAALIANAPDGRTGWTATARVARSPMPTWQLSVTAVCG